MGTRETCWKFPNVWSRARSHFQLELSTPASIVLGEPIANLGNPHANGIYGGDKARASRETCSMQAGKGTWLPINWGFKGKGAGGGQRNDGQRIWKKSDKNTTTCWKTRRRSINDFEVKACGGGSGRYSWLWLRRKEARRLGREQPEMPLLLHHLHQTWGSGVAS